MKRLFTFYFAVILMLASVSNSFSLPRNVLMEYCTGTWCGYCPCGHQMIDQIKSLYPNTIVIAYHGGASSADPWRNFNGSEIRTLMGFTAYPTAVFDRTNTPSNPHVTYDQWMGRIQNRYAAAPDANVRLQLTSKTYNDVTRELNVTLNATALANLNGQFKVSFVIVEDNVIYQQNHYSQCGFSGYIAEYRHAHIVRNMANGPTGENLNTNPDWSANETISKSVSATVDLAWVPINCKIVAFVYKEEASVALSTVEQALEEYISSPTIISGNSGMVASEYSLSQNYPNPFNPTTSIKFNLPKDGNVSFKIYDIYGKEVETYVDGFLQSGSYNVEFDGSKLSSGVYFYVLKSENFFDKKKMILLK